MPWESFAKKTVMGLKRSGSGSRLRGLRCLLLSEVDRLGITVKRGWLVRWLKKYVSWIEIGKGDIVRREDDALRFVSQTYGRYMTSRLVSLPAQFLKVTMQILFLLMIKKKKKNTWLLFLFFLSFFIAWLHHIYLMWWH